jgi:hypothetical protein
MKSTEEAGANGEQSISLFLAIGMVIGALVIGLVVGYVAAPKGDTAASDINNSATAPTLTQDQIENQQLPAGHPAIPGMSDSASETASDSASVESDGTGDSSESGSGTSN